MKKYILIGILASAISGIYAQSTTIEEHLQKYGEAYSNKDYDTAFKSIKECFNLTHALEYALILGEMHLMGQGTPVDLNRAKGYFFAVTEANVYDAEAENTKLMLAYANRMYANICCAEDNIDEALFHYKKAYSIANDAYSSYMIGYIYIYEKESADLKDGIAYLEKAARKNSIAALTELGFIYDEAGDKDQAMKYWLKAANIPLLKTGSSAGYSYLSNPNFENDIVIEAQNSAIFNIACFYEEMEEEEEAIVWLEKLTLEKEKYLNFKGKCYAVMGEKEKAIKTLERSIELYDNPKVYHVLGMFYAHWGNKEKAAKCYREAILRGNENAREQLLELDNE